MSAFTRTVGSNPTLSVMSMLHPAWVEIDTEQFRKNLKAIRKRIGDTLFCLPVKANAYGHGLCAIARLAEESGTVDLLGVSCLQEAERLRQANIALPIFVFGAVHEEQIDRLVSSDFEFTISSLYKAKLAAKRCFALDKKAKVHIEIDTGMQRTGVRPESLAELLSFIESQGCFAIAGAYSHFASSGAPQDPFTLKQIAAFRELALPLQEKGIRCHLANSGGVLFYPESYFDMVRPGLFCYGYLPDGNGGGGEIVRPCLSLKAKISYFKVVEALSGIGYGHAYVTAQKTRIATVPIGYGDGCRRELSHGGSILVRGKKCPVAGAVCMDQFMVDLGAHEAYVGDEAVLIGRQEGEEISLKEVADLCNTIVYEILVGLGERLPRIYC